MTSPGRHRFVARASEFEAIRAFIETACAEMAHDEQQRIVLLVEELFANSVSHGYGGGSDEPVWLTLRVGQDECHVVYEDRAPPYDPFAVARDGHVDDEVEDRPVGGLGIVLLAQLSSSHTYERRGDRNVIELHIPRARTH